jgi:hypothetical protein
MYIFFVFLLTYSHHPLFSQRQNTVRFFFAIGRQQRGHIICLRVIVTIRLSCTNAMRHAIDFKIVLFEAGIVRKIACMLLTTRFIDSMTCSDVTLTECHCRANSGTCAMRMWNLGSSDASGKRVGNQHPNEAHRSSSLRFSCSQRS